MPAPTLAHLAAPPACAGPVWLPAAIRLDRAPAALWLGLQALALWPAWAWMAARFADGSDDPLGLAAVAALAWLALRLRRQLRASPRLPWLAAALAGSVAATLLHRAPGAPPLVAALVAVLALAAGLLAFLPSQRRIAIKKEAAPAHPACRKAHFSHEAGGHGPARPQPPSCLRPVAALPVLGLAVLALPLLSSLQFYAGYPLRVLTAEASRWLLAPWLHAVREGSTLAVNGQLIVVDAPCSGVQMLWLGYFTACAVALAAGRGSRAFALRLPWVSALVLAGNVVRNAVLVALEAGGPAPGAWVHEAVGLAVLAPVCAAIAAVMAAPAPCPPAARTHGEGRGRWRAARRVWRNTFRRRVAFKAALAASLLLCQAATLPGLARPGPAAGALAAAAPEWPTRWHDGQPLRPLALSAVEARFARGFPGHLARLTDGRRILVLRQVQRPTRMLHPAADCYRALGWRIEDEGLMQPAPASHASPAHGGGLQRCFTARQGNTRLRVCEQIEDAAGRRFADTSAWYWAAALGQSPGPWRATTVAQPL